MKSLKQFFQEGRRHKRHIAGEHDRLLVPAIRKAGDESAQWSFPRFPVGDAPVTPEFGQIIAGTNKDIRRERFQFIKCNSCQGLPVKKDRALVCAHPGALSACEQYCAHGPGMGEFFRNGV